jgi:hypothetical protein
LIRRKDMFPQWRYAFAMFEVVITEHSFTEWEWRVCDRSGRPIMVGWQKCRKDAKYQGEGALFRLLASGWKTPSKRNGPRPGES